MVARIVSTCLVLFMFLPCPALLAAENPVSRFGEAFLRAMGAMSGDFSGIVQNDAPGKQQSVANAVVRRPASLTPL